MSDVEIEQKVTLSRAEVATWLGDLACALEEGSAVRIGLSAPPVTLEVPDRLRCELEIESDGDEVELEIELTWSRPRSGTDGAPAGPRA